MQLNKLFEEFTWYWHNISSIPVMIIMVTDFEFGDIKLNRHPVIASSRQRWMQLSGTCLIVNRTESLYQLSTFYLILSSINSLANDIQLLSIKAQHEIQLFLILKFFYSCQKRVNKFNYSRLENAFNSFYGKDKIKYFSKWKIINSIFVTTSVWVFLR